MSGATVAGGAGRPDDGDDGDGDDGDGEPEAEWFVARATEVLESHWRAPGFCVPNAGTYPWQWLWDSCFHAVCWARLGRPDRARAELANALSHQADDGFVPHITYWSATGRADDDTHAAFWGRPASSCLTQPPMYGHAVAELRRAGVDVGDDLVDRATRGLRFLLEARHRPGLGPVILHPWESGCDDSPRWDAWLGEHDRPDRQDRPDDGRAARWRQVKGDLVEAVRRASPAPMASPTASSAFEVAPAGFGALVAFNAFELAEACGDAALGSAAGEVVTSIDRRWSAADATWSDGVAVGPPATAAVRTADALLPVLVSADDRAVDTAFALLADPGAFGAPFGPTGVHRGEPSFDPGTYWRGPAWPQLTYLVWLAARRRGREQDAARLAAQLRAGARRSGLAEYWDPDNGRGMGAIPQSWSALAAVVT